MQNLYIAISCFNEPKRLGQNGLPRFVEASHDVKLTFVGIALGWRVQLAGELNERFFVNPCGSYLSSLPTSKRKAGIYELPLNQWRFA